MRAGTSAIDREIGSNQYRLYPVYCDIFFFFLHLKHIITGPYRIGLYLIRKIGQNSIQFNN